MNDKYLVIDNRLRNIEKEKLIELGYKLIEVDKNINLYNEISSHVDIVCTKIKDKIICDQSVYSKLEEVIKENLILRKI